MSKLEDSVALFGNAVLRCLASLPNLEDMLFDLTGQKIFNLTERLLFTNFILLRQRARHLGDAEGVALQVPIALIKISLLQTCQNTQN